MYEPITALTDLLLGLVAIFFGVKLCNSVGNNVSARVFLGGALDFIGISALFGTFNHGFVGPEQVHVKLFLWKLTMAMIGLAGYYFINAVILAARIIPRHGILVIKIAVTILFGIYIGTIIFAYDFQFVLAWLALTLLALSLFCFQSSPGRSEIMLGTLTTATGLVLWAMSVGLNSYINHNDLYHLIQIIAVSLFYFGGKKLQDAS